LELQSKTYLPKKGEEYMSLTQRAHFKQMLAAQKLELSKDIDRTVHEMQDDATVFADPTTEQARNRISRRSCATGTASAS